MTEKSALLYCHLGDCKTTGFGETFSQFKYFNAKVNVLHSMAVCLSVGVHEANYVCSRSVFSVTCQPSYST